jgi:hypothetical protein
MSRRFKNRHAKVKADPHAKPAAPVVLDDENSFVDPTQPDRRIPNALNTRAYVRASSSVDAERAKARAAAISKASKQSNGDDPSG